MLDQMNYQICLYYINKITNENKDNHSPLLSSPLLSFPLLSSTFLSLKTSEHSISDTHTAMDQKYNVEV